MSRSTKTSAPPETLALAEHVPLAPLTTWRIGGPARWYLEPRREEVRPALEWARDSGVPVVVLGRGSNVLVDSAGLDALVLCTRSALTNLEREGDLLVADAGVPLPKLAKRAADEGYSGFEFLAGIPGTVGGGVVINAGLTAFRPREISQVLEAVEIVDRDLRVRRLAASDIEPAYRQTNLLGADAFVLRAWFRLTDRGDATAIREATQAHLAERRRKQPLDRATAGSTFTQPPGGRAAGWYIERSGLKGLRVGGAEVSAKHANWIENGGGATSDDVKALIGEIQRRVAERFGVSLQREVRYLSNDSAAAAVSAIDTVADAAPATGLGARTSHGD